jgi:hypothetical protein
MAAVLSVHFCQCNLHMLSMPCCMKHGDNLNNTIQLLWVVLPTTWDTHTG